MTWVLFTSDFRYKPTARSALQYLKGSQKNVPHLIAEAAILQGKAIPQPTKPREEPLRRIYVEDKPASQGEKPGDLKPPPDA
jgi:hypothetical protein